MKFIVDASVAIKWYVPEVHSISAIRVLGRESSFYAPDLIYAEIGSTLWKKTRRGDLTRDQAAAILQGFFDVHLEIYPSAPLADIAFSLATSLGSSFYDSLYLALAVAQDSAVITADQKFHAIVKASPLARHVRWIADRE